MKFPVNDRIIASFQKYSKGTAIAVMVIGSAVLLGWVFDITILKSIISNWNSMSPNTALCFILSGFSLLLLQQKNEPETSSGDINLNSKSSFKSLKILGFIAVSIIVIISTLTLAENVFSMNIGINNLLLKFLSLWQNLLAFGPMSWVTAFCFFLITFPLAFWNIKNPKLNYFLQSVVLFVAGISFFVFLDYLYYTNYLFEKISEVKVAFHTSIAFILLSSGILFARPARGIMAIVSSDTLGGILIRKFFPVLIIIMIGFSELRYVGEQLGLYNGEFGLAIMITFSIIIISYVFWMAANYLGEEDIKGKILEKETKASELKFLTAFNLGSVPMTIQNLENRKFTEVNEVALELFGFKREEVIGHVSQELHIIDPDQSEKLNHILSEKGSIHNVEVILHKKSGEKVNVIISSEVIELDNQKYSQSVLIDITERIKTENELKKSNDRFLKLFYSNPIGMVLLNIETNKFQFVNEIFLSKFGYTNEEVIGKTPVDLKIIESNSYEKVITLLKQQGYVKDFETLVMKKNRELFWTISTLQTITFNGESFFLTSFYDITEQKKAEAELKQRTKELTESNKELEQFAYVASHDLQEPLRTVTNFTNLVKQKYSLTPDKENEQYFNLISVAISSMQQLIKDLLEYSRVGRNIVFEKIDCNKILQEVIADMDANIKENNAKINISILPVLMGNETELKRLFQNLISNAIKFRTKNTEPVIDITAEEKETEFLFAIKDNGIGIDEKYINKLFVIFQRLNLKGQYPGTGIGLATCKKIVNLHNGKIWVNSKFGEGSTFYFTISKQLTNNTL